MASLAGLLSVHLPELVRGCGDVCHRQDGRRSSRTMMECKPRTWKACARSTSRCQEKGAVTCFGACTQGSFKQSAPFFLSNPKIKSILHSFSPDEHHIVSTLQLKSSLGWPCLCYRYIQASSGPSPKARDACQMVPHQSRDPYHKHREHSQDFHQILFLETINLQ